MQRKTPPNLTSSPKTYVLQVASDPVPRVGRQSHVQGVVDSLADVHLLQLRGLLQLDLLGVDLLREVHLEGGWS